MFLKCLLQVLDSGIRTSLEDFTRICPPKIVIFDLVTDLPVRTIIFPRQALRPNSLLTNLIIDESVQGPCDNAFLYITDSAAPGLRSFKSKVHCVIGTLIFFRYCSLRFS